MRFLLLMLLLKLQTGYQFMFMLFFLHGHKSENSMALYSPQTNEGYIGLAESYSVSKTLCALFSMLHIYTYEDTKLSFISNGNRGSQIIIVVFHDLELKQLDAFI